MLTINCSLLQLAKEKKIKTEQKSEVQNNCIRTEGDRQNTPNETYGKLQALAGDTHAQSTFLKLGGGPYNLS
jgi:hypothetical protein